MLVIRTSLVKFYQNSQLPLPGTDPKEGDVLKWHYTLSAREKWFGNPISIPESVSHFLLS